MRLHRSLLPFVLVAGLVAASPTAVAGPTVEASTDDLPIAQMLAPPGSPDDGHLVARRALAEQARRGPVAPAIIETTDDGQEIVGPQEEVPGQRYPWRIPRSSVDRPDEKSGRLLHIVYVVASDRPDDHYDEAGVIEDSIRSMNHWMREQTGDKQWRLDTFTFLWTDPEDPEAEPVEIEAVDVTFIESTRTASQLSGANNVRAELLLHDLNEPNKRYLAYVAGGSGGVCGDAFWTLDPFAGDIDGKYSNVYLYSSSGCRARDFAEGPESPSWTETIAMQEMIHNDGVVTLLAPHGCQVSLLAYGHVCTGPLSLLGNLDPESVDVMFPYVGRPLNDKVLDRDRDDYFRHPFPYRDLDDGLYLEGA